MHWSSKVLRYYTLNTSRTKFYQYVRDIFHQSKENVEVILFQKA